MNMDSTSGGTRDERRGTSWIGIGLVTALAALTLTCSGGAPKASRAPLTERQRDSVIGASRLPGAQGVRGALRAQDSMQARANRADSVQ